MKKKNFRFGTKVAPRDQHIYEAYKTVESYRERIKSYRMECFMLSDYDREVTFKLELDRVDKWLKDHRKLIRIFIKQAS